MPREGKIGIIHNIPVSRGQTHWESSTDVLIQVDAIQSELKSLGHSSVRIPFTRDLESFMAKIKEARVDLVFNLCETVDEEPTLVWHPAALLELLGVAFSGSPSSALMLTADKLVTKRMLKAAGIATPNCLGYDGTEGLRPSKLRFPVIVKPRFEDASIGIDQESIFEDEASLLKGIASFKERFDSVLVEEYIAGREFNISLFGYPSAAVLPLAEIDFSAFTEDRYPIVGYRAKWEKESFEYQNTPRVFPDELPRGLRPKLERTALACFHLFQVRDYGRVDMRVDPRGVVYVLEVNANPCLSPDAGLAAAFLKAGSSYSDLVGNLVDFAKQRMSHGGHTAGRPSG